MLAIRMQRTGRKGHAQYRVVVQDSRFSPSSGRVVEYLGSYNPHTKAAVLDKEKATNYLKNGARPSERVVKLFGSEGIDLPNWVSKPAERKKDIRNIEKLRRNRPAEEAATEPVEAAETEAAEESAESAEASAEAPEATAEASEEPAAE